MSIDSGIKSPLSLWINKVADPKTLSEEQKSIDEIIRLRRSGISYMIEIDRLINIELCKIKMPYANSLVFVPVKDKTSIIHLFKDKGGCMRIHVAENAERIEPGVLAIG